MMINPKCLACGCEELSVWATTSDAEYFSVGETFDYLKCQRCAALSIDPVPRERLNEIYPPTYYSFDSKVTTSFTFKIKDKLDQRFFKKFISKLPQEKINVLDVGGGGGWQLSALKKVDARIARTVIVDLDENAGQNAQALGHEFFCGRFEEYASAKPFDVILMLNLIEHVDNPKEMLEKANALLSKNGIIILKTPNIDSLDARMFRHHNWGGYHSPRHWILFNKENFESLTKAAGLAIDHFKFTQGAPFWTSSMLFALHKKGWIQASKERPIPKHPLYGFLNIGFACLDLLRGVFWKTSQMIIVLRKA